MFADEHVDIPCHSSEGDKVQRVTLRVNVRKGRTICPVIAKGMGLDPCRLRAPRP
jgi:hypothetical protein